MGVSQPLRQRGQLSQGIGAASPELHRSQEPQFVLCLWERENCI